MPKGNKGRIFLKLLGRLGDVWLMQKLQQDLILISFSISVAENLVCFQYDKKPKELILFEVLFV